MLYFKKKQKPEVNGYHVKIIKRRKESHDKKTGKKLNAGIIYLLKLKQKNY